MPSLSANAATYRAGNYSYKGYIGTFPQTVVWTATLNSTPTFPATSLTVTTVSGSSASALRGMTVRVESAAGVFRGLLRIASSGTLNSTTMPINEVSANTVNLTSTDVLKVVQEWRIWDMLVSATAQLNKDSRIVFSDQAANPEPIANLGGLWFGFHDAGQVYATVTLDGTASLIVDPDGGSLSYLWSVGSGTITVGTTTTSSITVRFPVGFHVVTLTITNSGSGKTRIRYVPVRVYDHDANQPLAVLSDGCQYVSHEEGWALNFALPKGSEATQANFPDGSLIVYFEEEFYGAVQVSYGSNVANRSHVKFVGYVTRENLHVEQENTTVTFEAVSPLAILNRTEALPQLMVTTTGSGTKWRHVKTLTFNRAFWYIIHYGATLDVQFDFVWKSGTSFAYSRLSVTETSSVGAQLRDLAQSLACDVTCDRLGRILIIAKPNYLTGAERNALTTTYAITAADFMDMDMTREHRGNVKSVRVNAILAGATKALNRPVFANAGNAPSSIGTDTEVLDKQVVETQADANRRAGWHFAHLNGTDNGRYVPMGARFRLPSGYDWIDPAYREWFTLTLASTANKRGLTFSSGDRFTAESVSISHDHENGTKELIVTFDHETDGPTGVKYVPPQPSDNGLPPYTPPDFYLPPIIQPSPGQLPSNPGTIAVLSTTGVLYVTGDFETPLAAGGPTWVSTSLAPTGTVLGFVVDPFSPGYRGTGTAINGWMLTSSRIYKLNDIFGTPSITLQKTFAGTNTHRTIATERLTANQNFVLVASQLLAGGGTVISRTTDGSTWADVTVTAHYNTSTGSGVNLGGDDATPALHVSGHIAGRAYVCAYTATAAGQSATAELHQTDDYGATWVQVTGMSTQQWQGQCMHVPYNDNPSDDLFYWTDIPTASTMLAQRTNKDGSVDSIDAVSGASTGGFSNARSIDSCALDRLSMAAIYAIAGSNFTNALYTSRDGGDTWTQRSTPSASIGGRYNRAFVSGSNRNTIYVLGESGQVDFSSDFGAYLDDRRGNISTSSTMVAIIGR